MCSGDGQVPGGHAPQERTPGPATEGLAISGNERSQTAELSPQVTK